MDTESENNITGPDYFGFYSREVAELFAQVEDTMNSAGQQIGVSRESSLTKNHKSGYELKLNCKTGGSAPLFSDVVGSQLSDFAKERLKALVRQSLFTFTKEVDSVLAAVLGICRFQSILSYKESLLKLSDAAKDEHSPRKKQRVLGSVVMDDDLRLLLDNKSSKVEEILKKHSAQLLATIERMKQKLEDFIELLLSNFRLMTLAEKQKLQKMIQNLPPTNLDRVVEIIQHGGPVTEEIQVDLEEQSKVTLWRLYYYVEAVENARKL